MGINATLNRLKTLPGMAGFLHSVPPSWKAAARRRVDSFTQPSKLERLLAQASQTNDLLARMLYEQAFSTERFQEPKRLLKHGFKVYSQHDEDGIIEEIFKRIGETDRYFVEFGVGDGIENCTTYLLLKGWSGAWIDGSAECFEGIQRNLKAFLHSGNLKALYSFITAENIEQLFERLSVPEEFDFLSIDIDRNDLWVWKALSSYRPRVVAIEYNASFKQTVSCTIPYNSNAIWDGTNFSGASLKALENIGLEKGYRLVGCNFTGVTSFFVREDCVGDHFAEPFASENHYEPPRFFVRMPNGHRPNFGPVVHIPPPLADTGGEFALKGTGEGYRKL
jgi:hypothetical protein